MVKPARAAGELMGEQRNQTAYWLELLVDGNMMPAEKLSPLRQECDELIAIFVTILKRSKETS